MGFEEYKITNGRYSKRKVICVKINKQFLEEYFIMAKVNFTGLVILFLSIFITGCSTTSGSGRATTIEYAYPERFLKTKIGMDLRNLSKFGLKQRKSAKVKMGLFMSLHMVIYLYMRQTTLYMRIFIL
jgi:hypothetical protein